MNEASLLEEWQEQAEAEFAAKAKAMERAFGRGLQKVWGQFGEAILGTWKEAWETYEGKWTNTDHCGRLDIESEIVDTVAHRLSELAAELFPSEIAGVAASVQEQLGSIWEALSEDEQKYLATGRRLMGDEPLHRFAGLSLGLAVEKSLSDYLFNYLRNPVQDQQLPEVQVNDNKDRLESIVANFFNSNKCDHLMLGQMVGAFNRAAHSDTPATRPADRLIAAYLAELPGAQNLLEADKATRTIRRKALDRINEIRVNCAHPKQPPGKEI